MVKNNIKDNLREKLKDNVETISEKYFIDPKIERIIVPKDRDVIDQLEVEENNLEQDQSDLEPGEDAEEIKDDLEEPEDDSYNSINEIENFKVTLGALSYLGQENTLLVGDPGNGKTTFANLIGSTFSGLPYDLFARTQIQGHPDQSKELMFSRADISKIDEKEEVIWQNSLFMPSILIDEFNRLPEGKQSIAQELIRTGYMEHLNHVFYRGDIPFFATVNHEGDGTYSITPPNLDRFAISLEFTPLKGYHQPYIKKASDKIQQELTDPELSNKILRYLNQTDLDGEEGYTEKLKRIDNEFRIRSREKLEVQGLKPFTLDEEEKFRELVKEVELSNNAHRFLKYIYDAFNIKPTGDFNRSSEISGSSDLDEEIVSSRIEDSLSSRRYQSINKFSKMLAFFDGEEKANLGHVKAVAPYCLSHALEFSEDYASKFRGRPNPKLENEREVMDLARRSLNDIKENYGRVVGDLRTIGQYQGGEELEDIQKDRLKKLAGGAPIDDPYLREMGKFIEVDDNGKLVTPTYD